MFWCSPYTDIGRSRSFARPSPACFPKTSFGTVVLLGYTYSPMRRTHSRVTCSEDGKMARHQVLKSPLLRWASISIRKLGRDSSFHHFIDPYILHCYHASLCRAIERVCRVNSELCTLGPATLSSATTLARVSSPSSSSSTVSSPSNGYASSSTTSIVSHPSGNSVGLSC